MRSGSSSGSSSGFASDWGYDGGGHDGGAHDGGGHGGGHDGGDYGGGRGDGEYDGEYDDGAGAALSLEETDPCHRLAPSEGDFVYLQLDNTPRGGSTNHHGNARAY